MFSHSSPCDLLKQLTGKKSGYFEWLGWGYTKWSSSRVSFYLCWLQCEVAKAAVLLLALLLAHCLTLEKSPNHLGFAFHYELETWISFSERFSGSQGKPGPSFGVQPDGFIIWALCTRGLRFWLVTRWNIMVSIEFCFEFLGSAALLT